MTTRLFHADAYSTTFTAHITRRLTVARQPAVILDQTLFYPTSGGQPYDTGRLNGREGNSVRVVDVRSAADGAILHLLDAPLADDAVEGIVDWERRFDLMQHHTGQHILSQACLRLAEAPTVGFHLTADNATIDVDATDLTATQCGRIEELANAVVWENVPVTAEFVSPAEAGRRHVRKIPDIDGDRLRLVSIGDFDVTACGGTHVARSGSVGLVKIVRRERRGSTTRLEFRCGARALGDYEEKNDIISRLTASLTTGRAELPEAVARLQAELKAVRRENRQLISARQAWHAQQLLAAAVPYGNARLVCHLETAASDLRALARQLSQEPGVVALLVAGGERTELVFARADDAPGDMNHLLQTAVTYLGKAGGGGNTAFAQGGGPPHTVERLRGALEAAADAWRTMRDKAHA